MQELKKCTAESCKRAFSWTKTWTEARETQTEQNIIQFETLSWRYLKDDFFLSLFVFWATAAFHTVLFFYLREINPGSMTVSFLTSGTDRAINYELFFFPVESTAGLVPLSLFIEPVTVCKSARHPWITFNQKQCWVNFYLSTSLGKVNYCVM